MPKKLLPVILWIIYNKYASIFFSVCQLVLQCKLTATAEGILCMFSIGCQTKSPTSLY